MESQGPRCPYPSRRYGPLATAFRADPASCRCPGVRCASEGNQPADLLLAAAGGEQDAVGLAVAVEVAVAAAMARNVGFWNGETSSRAANPPVNDTRTPSFRFFPRRQVDEGDRDGPRGRVDGDAQACRGSGCVARGVHGCDGVGERPVSLHRRREGGTALERAD